MNLGDRIKQTRQEKGLTQQELAETSGVCQQMISKLEVGKANGTADIVKLAYALDVSPAWLEGIEKNRAIVSAGANSKKKKQTEGDALNQKAIQATIEYLTKEPPALFTRSSFRRQSDLFSRCYEICTQPKNKRLNKADLMSLLKRRVKRA